MAKDAYKVDVTMTVTGPDGKVMAKVPVEYFGLSYEGVVTIEEAVTGALLALGKAAVAAGK